MNGRDGIFDDYMGTQYREGQKAFKDGLNQSQHSYGKSQMGRAFEEGWEYAYNEENEIPQ